MVPLVSTLPRRAEAVTLEDFERANIGIKVSYYQKKSDVVDIWNQYVDYSPAAIDSLFDEFYGDEFKLSIQPRFDNELRFVIHHRDTYDPLDNYIAQQLYDLKRKIIHGTEIKLPEALRAHGAGRRLGMRLIDLDIALGISEIAFESTLENGGYAWAIMGYNLDRSSSDKVRAAQSLAAHLQKKLAVLRPYLPTNIFNRAKTFAHLCNADDLYQLAQIDFDLTPHLPEGAFTDPSLKDVFNDRENTVDKMAKVVSFCRERKKPITIAKLLLNGEAWYATLNYQDPVQMKRLTDYAGPLEFSRPADSLALPTPPVPEAALLTI